MSQALRWTVHLSNFLVTGSGVVYAWMLYFTESDDPFSVVNHPWQPDVQRLHILAAPALVFALGLIWSDHAWEGFRSRSSRRRRTGLLLLSMAMPMIASGYALQVSVDETWRELWLWCHLVTSGGWVIGSLSHLFVGRNESNGA